MRTIRNGLRLVLTASVTMACVAINETATDRDLECTTTPEAICIRAADIVEKVHPAAIKEMLEDGPVTVFVRPLDCADAGGVARPVVHCWKVEVTDGAVPEVASDLIELDLFELPDGTLSVSRY